MNKLLQIIKEVIDQWVDDEPSILDKYYEKKFGSYPSQPQTNELPSGQLIGYLTKAWSQPLNKPIPVYKNPKNLNAFYVNARGVLTDNGDIYVATSPDAMHLNIVQLLGQKGIIPSTSVDYNYGQTMPEEYMTIIRQGRNKFVQSSAYNDDLPIYYEAMFDLANEVQPFNFEIMPN